MSRGPLWSDEDWEKAKRLARLGRDAGQIAAEMHRTEEAIRARFAYMRERVPRRSPSNGTGNYATSAKASDEQIAERDARYAAAARRTQTQEFFGDPPPGFSALDKKRQQGQRA